MLRSPARLWPRFRLALLRQAQDLLPHPWEGGLRHYHSERTVRSNKRCQPFDTLLEHCTSMKQHDWHGPFRARKDGLPICATPRIVLNIWKLPSHRRYHDVEPRVVLQSISVCSANVRLVSVGPERTSAQGSSPSRVEARERRAHACAWVGEDYCIRFSTSAALA